MLVRALSFCVLNWPKKSRVVRINLHWVSISEFSSTADALRSLINLVDPSAEFPQLANPSGTVWGSIMQILKLLKAL